MDDSLEQPTALPNPSANEDREEDEQLSDDEDQGPDWTKLPSVSVARPVIPKRGEKDFEPNAQGGSGLQRHVIDRSRNAMLDALRATRTISRKIELLPEETLYLVERGSMFCWEASQFPLSETPGLDDMEGVPMTVQQAFAEMIGLEDLTLEKYQVYSYLRRLGYVVTRTKPPTADYPTPPPFLPKKRKSASIFVRVYKLFGSAISRVSRIFLGGFNWWRPLRSSRWLHHNMDYGSVFKSLRFLPSGHDVPLQVKKTPSSPPSPYEIFYNLYKPSTPFKKTAPPPPDFSVVVVNARTTPMPSLMELTDLFGVLPELPPPAPRKRLSYAQQKAGAAAKSPHPSPAPIEQPLLRKFFWWMLPAAKLTAPPRYLNPFPSLKTGNKMVVVAAVDAGMISFFRFGQGVFTEWPMV
ncbi:putative tRNA-splicing endonuclease subunit sen54 [Grifola frondosa]|uniref:Putative tRNA-splicing endonuclease subunit sen54 n=1 Tax=Grifola frondosa TaxID=5627 RepID=A0A1C7LW82_GRIFR|nr:putative tRNA-splicing endonuclease subunit sen54 [Grifola frondosa]